MTFFVLIQDRADISCPTVSPTGFWLGHRRVSPVITSYPIPCLEYFICLFLFFRVYVRGAVAGLHQSCHPLPLLSVVICFAMFIWCLRVQISYFWVPIWYVCGCCFHVLLRVFHVFILKYLWLIFKYDLKWYFITCSNKSWISVQVLLNLVCKPISYCICLFYNNL